jgi:hypothetical protein
MAIRVVVHIDHVGNENYMADGDVDFFVVDERAPRDRVFQLSNHIVHPQEITNVLGTSRVGRIGDMPGVEAEIAALIDGKPAPRTKLNVVPSNDDA